MAIREALRGFDADDAAQRQIDGRRPSPTSTPDASGRRRDNLDDATIAAARRRLEAESSSSAVREARLSNNSSVESRQASDAVLSSIQDGSFFEDYAEGLKNDSSPRFGHTTDEIQTGVTEFMPRFTEDYLRDMDVLVGHDDDSSDISRAATAAGHDVWTDEEKGRVRTRNDFIRARRAGIPDTGPRRLELKAEYGDFTPAQAQVIMERVFEYREKARRLADTRTNTNRNSDTQDSALALHRSQSRCASLLAREIAMIREWGIFDIQDFQSIEANADSAKVTSVGIGSRDYPITTKDKELAMYLITSIDAPVTPETDDDDDDDDDDDGGAGGAGAGGAGGAGAGGAERRRTYPEFTLPDGVRVFPLEEPPELSDRLRRAKDEWAYHIDAARSKAIPLFKGTKGKLERSGNAWTESKDALMANLREQGQAYLVAVVQRLANRRSAELQEEGLSPERLEEELNAYAFHVQEILQNRLNQELRDYEKNLAMQVTGQSSEMSERKYDNYPKPVRKALDFWARRGGGKFFSKHRIFGNIAKLAAVGIPAAVVGGIATVATGGMLPVAMAAGALTGLGITKGIGAGLMGARTAKGENAPRVVDAITRDIEAEFDRQLAENGTINHRETNKKTRKITWRNRRRNLTGITVGAGSANIAASVATNLWLTPNVTAVGPGVQPVHATPNGPVSFGPTAPPAPPVTPNGVPISPGDGIINAIDKIFGTVGSPASPDAAYNALLNGNIDPTAVLQDAVSGAPVDVVQMGVPGPGGWGITGAEIGNNVMLTPQAAAYLSNLGMI